MSKRRSHGEDDNRVPGGATVPARAEQTIMIEREVFYASVRSPAARALVASARAVQASRQFPPNDPPELRR